MSVGTRCTLRAYWWEDPAPVEGDFLRTAAGSCYRIEEICDSRSEHIAHVLICTRLGKDAVQLGDPGVREWVWASRTPSSLDRSTD